MGIVASYGSAPAAGRRLGVGDNFENKGGREAVSREVTATHTHTHSILHCPSTPLLQNSLAKIRKPRAGISPSIDLILIGRTGLLQSEPLGLV